MSEMTKLHELARVAGTLAGLTEQQIPGLAELFRIAWVTGAKAQAREDADACERMMKRWETFREEHGIPLPGPDGDYIQGRINAAAELQMDVRRLANPDEEPEPVPPPPPSMPEPVRMRPRRSPRGKRT
jgi:hypothetical protein